MYSQNQPINPRLVWRPPYGPGAALYGERQPDSSIISNFMKNGRAAASGSWGTGSSMPLSSVLREGYGHPSSDYVWSNQFPLGNKKFPNRVPMDSVARELQHRSFPSRRWGSNDAQPRGWKSYEGHGIFQRAANIATFPATKSNKSIEEIMKEKIRDCLGTLEQVHMQISLSNAIGQKSSESVVKDADEAKNASNNLKLFNESLQKELTPLKSLIDTMTSSDVAEDPDGLLADSAADNSEDQSDPDKVTIAKLRKEVRSLRAELGQQKQRSVLETCTQTEQKKHSCLKIQKELDLVSKKVWKLQNSLRSLREKTSQMEELHHKINHELISKVFAYKKLQQDYEVVNRNLGILETYVKSREFKEKSYYDGSSTNELTHQLEMMKCHFKCLYTKYEQNRQVMDQLKYQVFGILKSLDSPHRLNFQKYQSNFFEMWRVGHIYPIICKCLISECLCKPPSKLSIDIMAEKKSLFYCTPVTELWRDDERYNGTTLLVETDFTNKPQSPPAKAITCKGTLYSDHINCCGGVNVESIKDVSLHPEDNCDVPVPLKLPFVTKQSEEAEKSKEEEEKSKHEEKKESTVQKSDTSAPDIKSSEGNKMSSEVSEGTMSSLSGGTSSSYSLSSLPSKSSKDSSPKKSMTSTEGSSILIDSLRGSQKFQVTRRKHSSSEGDSVPSPKNPELILINIPFSIKEDQLKEVLGHIGEFTLSDLMPMSGSGGKWKIHLAFKNPEHARSLLKEKCITVSEHKIPVVGVREFERHFSYGRPQNLHMSLDEIFFANDKSFSLTSRSDKTSESNTVGTDTRDASLKSDAKEAIKSDASKLSDVQPQEKDVSCFLSDLEKVFPRVPRSEIEGHVQNLQEKYDNQLTRLGFSTVVRNIYTDRLYATGVEETVCCLLCAKPYGEEETRVISCYHCFHSDCLVGWSMVMDLCPTCHKEIQPFS